MFSKKGAEPSSNSTSADNAFRVQFSNDSFRYFKRYQEGYCNQEITLAEYEQTINAANPVVLLAEARSKEIKPSFPMQRDEEGYFYEPATFNEFGQLDIPLNFFPIRRDPIIKFLNGENHPELRSESSHPFSASMASPTDSEVIAETCIQVEKPQAELIAEIEKLLREFKEDKIAMMDHIKQMSLKDTSPSKFTTAAEIDVALKKARKAQAKRDQQLQELQEINNKLRAESALEKQIHSYDKEIHELEVDDLMRQIEIIRAENEGLQSELEQIYLNTDALNQKLKSAQLEAEKKQYEIAELTQRALRAERLLQEAMEARQKQDREVVIQQQAEIIAEEALKQELEFKKTLDEALAKAEERHKAEKEALTKKSDEYAIELLKNFHAIESGLRELLDTYDRQAREARANLDKKIAECKDLKQTISRLEDEKDVLLDENDQLRDERDDLEAKNSELTEQQNALEEEIDSLKKICESLEVQRDNLSEELIEAKSKLLKKVDHVLSLSAGKNIASSKNSSSAYQDNGSVTAGSPVTPLYNQNLKALRNKENQGSGREFSPVKSLNF